MAVTYKVTIARAQENQFRVTWVNEQTWQEDSFFQEAPRITAEDVNKLQYDPNHGLEIGRKLFRFLDGSSRYLERALAEAAQYGGDPVLFLEDCKDVSHWPFELLARESNYLLPYRLHLVRRLSSWGEKKQSLLEDRPLRLLFMACSAIDAQPELDFEREEEIISRITENLDMDMDVEDSGSLEGLRLLLEQERFDVVHLSCLADIDNRGWPYFIMENEAGLSRRVSPSELWEQALIENPPRLLVLSGHLTGMKPDSGTVASFARAMVENYKVPSVLEWGCPVGQKRINHASGAIYRQLSRGKSILEAVRRGRFQLGTDFPDDPNPVWALLCLFSTGRELGPIVKEGRKKKHKLRKLSEEGFVGRRRQLQHSLRTLENDKNKIGLLLHGTAGLGKSALAMKICERLKNHTLITVRGKLDTVILAAALKDAFIAAQEKKGQEILSQKIEMKDKLANLCATSFKEKNYLLILDNFEQNLEGGSEGQPGYLVPEAAQLLTAFLHYLPLSGKMTQLIVTSRYLFSLTEHTRDLVKVHLEPVCLTGLQIVEQHKKAKTLKNIANYIHSADSKDLLTAGRGNPLLMEWLDQLVGKMGKSGELPLGEAVKKKQAEFNKKHEIPKLIRHGGNKLETFLNRFSVFRRPVSMQAVEQMGTKAGLNDWAVLLERGVALGLLEYDQARRHYLVTPLVREELWASLDSSSQHSCHRAAFQYYRNTCKTMTTSIEPHLLEEWIYHALGCGEESVASEQGGRLIDYLAGQLNFHKSRRIGEWILESKKQELATAHDASLLNELGKTLSHQWDFRKALDYFQQALKIDEALFGSLHLNVARDLNNLGVVLNELGEHRNAFDYFQRALEIWKKVDGENVPRLSTGLNNLGAASAGLGEHGEALDYYRQAFDLTKKLYGEKHPQTAACLNNLGSISIALGKEQQALDYCNQALDIWRDAYGEKHPWTAAGLSNLGEAWYVLGHYRKAFDYFQQAHGIMKEIYGEMHPQVAVRLYKLGLIRLNLGEKQKAKEYFEQAYIIFKECYGEDHPHTVTVKKSLQNSNGNL
jgi:tetratricopeptide (TPR) repeat protein